MVWRSPAAPRRSRRRRCMGRRRVLTIGREGSETRSATDQESASMKLRSVRPARRRKSRAFSTPPVAFAAFPGGRRGGPEMFSPTASPVQAAIDPETLPLVPEGTRIGLPCVGRVGKFVAIGLNDLNTPPRPACRSRRAGGLHEGDQLQTSGPNDEVIAPRGFQARLGGRTRRRHRHRGPLRHS